MNHRLVILLCCLGSVGACEFLADPLEPLETADTGTPEVTPPPRPEIRCNSVVDDVGVAGGHAVDTFSFTWAADINVAFAPGMEFRIPEDTRSLAFTGLANEGLLAVSRVQWNGEEITSQLSTDPLLTGSVQSSIPTNYATDITLDVPTGGGCLKVDLIGSPELAGGPGQLNLLTRRGGDANLIDLNFIFVGGTESQLSAPEAQEMIDFISTTWNRQGGPRVGQAQTFTLTGNALATYGQAVLAAGSAVEPEDPTGVDVFFFADLTDGSQGLLGFAGGVPGVLGFDGFAGSGVVILLDSHRGGDGSLSGDDLGSTIAHEVGHQVGLNHASERDGTSAAKYTDVPLCGPGNDSNNDGEVDAFECQGRGAENFMFWQGGFQLYQISPEQAFVLSRSAITK